VGKGKKKKGNVILIAVGVVVVVAAFLLINPIRSLIAISTMSPLKSQEIVTGVYAINNGFVNLYLLQNGNQYIAFDAGNDNEATMRALDDFGIDSDDVSAVFLTHTDADHVAAVSLFTSADVYMAESNQTFLLTDEGQSRSKVFADMNRGYGTLSDGETITVKGAQIQCIYTPGHTDGSACYVVNGIYLFTGDNLNLNNGKVVLFVDVFNMNNDEQSQSIRKLSRLEGIEALFTMHSGYTTDFKTAFSEWDTQD